MRMRTRRRLFVCIGDARIVGLLDDFYERHREFARSCELSELRFSAIFLRAATRKANENV